jgi:glucose/arabinose dehydrogenase
LNIAIGQKDDAWGTNLAGILNPPRKMLKTTFRVSSSGLLGIAFDPNFAANQFIDVYYTATTPAVHNRISRFKANGDVVDASAGELVLLDFDNLSSATNHNGGALHFGVDGKL